MENTNIQSALEILNKPEAVYQFVTRESVPQDATVPTMDLEDEAAAELLVAIANGVSADNATFNQAYQVIKEKNDVVTRGGLTEILPYLVEAKQFVSDHSGTIFFILMYLNKGGYLDKLKNDAKFKTFFKTLFDE